MRTIFGLGGQDDERIGSSKYGCAFEECGTGRSTKLNVHEKVPEYVHKRCEGLMLIVSGDGGK